MKLALSLVLLILAGPSGPAAAETVTPVKGCPLAGSYSDASEDCKAMRTAYQAEVTACINNLAAEAAKKYGNRADNSSHGYRARFQICDAEVRAVFGQLSN